ncbi:MAG: hypothetical protein JWQ71_717 [Pedosphaera sp.]|nr:hypothetical protein [Pedosphaera sp.]
MSKIKRLKVQAITICCDLIRVNASYCELLQLNKMANRALLCQKRWETRLDTILDARWRVGLPFPARWIAKTHYIRDAGF